MSSIVINGVEWPVEGAQVAIVERGRVLLQFRPWPPGWELPGGHVEPGEDPAVTGARETEEETGLSSAHRRHRRCVLVARTPLGG